MSKTMEMVCPRCRTPFDVRMTTHPGDQGGTEIDGGQYCWRCELPVGASLPVVGMCLSCWNDGGVWTETDNGAAKCATCIEENV